MSQIEIFKKAITDNQIFSQVTTTASGPYTSSGIAQDTSGKPINSGDSLVGTSGAP